MPTQPANDLTGACGTPVFVSAPCIYSPREAGRKLLDAGCGVTVGVLWECGWSPSGKPTHNPGCGLETVLLSRSSTLVSRRNSW